MSPCVIRVILSLHMIYVDDQKWGRALVIRRFIRNFAPKTNKMMKRILFIVSLLAAVSLSMVGQSKFVTVQNGHFVKDGKPYYYVGTNFW